MIDHMTALEFVAWMAYFVIVWEVLFRKAIVLAWQIARKIHKNAKVSQ